MWNSMYISKLYIIPFLVKLRNFQHSLYTKHSVPLSFEITTKQSENHYFMTSSHYINKYKLIVAYDKIIMLAFSLIVVKTLHKN